MFGISFAELIIISLLVLVVMGPEKLPEVARWAGKGLRELRQASNTLRNALAVEQHQSAGKLNSNTPRTDNAASNSRPTEASEAPSPTGPGKSASATDSAGPDSTGRTEIGATPGESPPPSNIDQVGDEQFDEMLQQRLQSNSGDATDEIDIAAGASPLEATDIEMPPTTEPTGRALFDIALPPSTAPETAR